MHYRNEIRVYSMDLKLEYSDDCFNQIHYWRARYIRLSMLKDLEVWQINVVAPLLSSELNQNIALAFLYTT